MLPNNNNCINRSFGYFPHLHDDIQLHILSFVADAPFESNNNTMPGNVPQSSLTHTLPYVCKKVRSMCNVDNFWKAAIDRQLRREPFLWKSAVKKIMTNSLRSREENDQNSSAAQAAEQQQQDIVVSAYHASGETSYKCLYQRLLTQYLRFKGPVFFMPGQVHLGQVYALHFFEPRYRLLIADVMSRQSDDAKHGGRIDGEVVFLHAHRAPLAPTTPATLVHVVRCELYPDGRADVWLLPVAFVWLERLWVRPDSGHLFYAQCMRMGADVTKEMDRGSRGQQIIMERLERVLMGGDDSDDSLNEFMIDREDEE